MAKKAKNELPSGPSRLTRIGVEGFKSIDDLQTLDLAPVTILAGANSAGKSSMMQPLLMLKQTLEAPYDPGGLLLSGDNVKLTSADQMFFRCPGEEQQREFAIELETSDGRWLRLMYSCPRGEGIVLAEMRYRKAPDSRGVRIHPEMSSDEVRSIIPPRISKFAEDSAEDAGEKRAKPLRWHVTRKRFYLAVTLDGDEDALALLPGGDSSSSPAGLFLRQIAGIVHLPGLRGIPERAYPTTAVKSDYPGTFEHYVASVINYWQKSGDPRAKEVGQDLKSLGLTWKVDAKRIDDTQVELRVGRLPGPQRGGANDLVNIADVGFGVSQVLPVLVALHGAEPGRVVYLEQPEIVAAPSARSCVWNGASMPPDSREYGCATCARVGVSLIVRQLKTLGYANAWSAAGPFANAGTSSLAGVVSARFYSPFPIPERIRVGCGTCPSLAR